MSTCFYCKSSQHKQIHSVQSPLGKSYDLHLCNQCETLFLNPQPTAQDLSKAYAEEYYGMGENKFHPFIENQVQWIRNRLAKRLSKGLSQGSRVLDIGCGNGAFLSGMGKYKSLELVGIEPAGKSAERALKRKEIELIESQFENLNLSQDSFDAINLMHVFEHLGQPKKVLEKCSKLLKPKGQLWIEIPNIRSWQYQLFERHWFHLDAPRHLHFMNSKTLEEDLESLGFDLIKKKTFSFQFGPFGWQQSLLNALGFPKERLYENLKGNPNDGVKMRVHQYAAGLFFLFLSLPFFFLLEVLASTFHSGSILRLELQKN